MQATVVLKKYSNRRLYDTERSLHVTLPEVAEIIRQGRQIRVLDAKTKEDVTAFILTQVVLEEARNRNALLPTPVLHLIIQFGDSLLGEFFENYLQQIIQTYLAHKAMFEEQFKQWIASGMNLSEVARRSMGDLSGFKTLFELNPFLASRSPDPPDEGQTQKIKK